MRRFASVFLGVLLLAPPLEAQGRALSADDVVLLLEMNNGDIVPFMARESCVSFLVTDAVAKRLSTAGASTAAVHAIRLACFSGTELVVQSFPTGAEVVLNNNGQVVGRTPWTHRYEESGSLHVTVRTSGRQQSAAVQLNPGMRTRAFFGVAEELLDVPRVRLWSEVANQLDLASRWKPIAAEPRRMSINAMANGVLFVPGGMVAGAGLGALYCSGETRCLALTEKPDERTVAGMFIGMGVGLIGGWVGMKLWDRRYDRLNRNHDTWSGANVAARQAWIMRHPETEAAIAADRRKRDEALAVNARIQARNKDIPASAITSERLPGPVTP